LPTGAGVRTIDRVGIGSASRRLAAVLGVAGLVVACGASTSAIGASLPATGAAGRSATAVAGSGCSDAGLRAFARERRLAPAERSALDALVVELARHPLRIRCASSSLEVLGSGRAPGRPDHLCLEAAAFVAPLLDLPGIPAAVESAARRANTAIHTYEQHGSTFCTVPG
jgi:hypothetical protein